MFSATDEAFMRRALDLAAMAMNHATPNPRVGCVLVRDRQVIAEGFTQRPGEPHAEAHAIRNARGKGLDLTGATAYVTLEPCNHFGKTPPCTEALIGAGVGRVVAAMEDPNPRVSGTGFERLREAGIDVRVGLLQQDATELNIGFIKRMATGLPWVRCKVAASIDGRTGLANGESKWITGDEARRDVEAQALAPEHLAGHSPVRGVAGGADVEAAEELRELAVEARRAEPPAAASCKPVL